VESDEFRLYANDIQRSVEYGARTSLEPTEASGVL